MAKVEQDTVSAFGEAVRATRIRKGWNQPDLDEAMQGGIDKSHLSAIENGRRKGLSPVTVSRLVTALEMDPSWLEHWIPGGLEKATARADAVLKKAQETDAFAEMRKHNISENEIIELAQTTAFEIEDLGQAWQELTNFVEMAVRVQKEGRGGSNHGGFVDEVLARVAEFSREGEYAEASDAIDEALKQAEAEQVRLLDSGVEVAMLARDTEKAATLLIRKADIEAGGVAEIEALRLMVSYHLDLGRDKGLTLESRLAIDLARQVRSRAVRQFDKRATLDDLAIALATLGERESNPKRLELAVDAFKKNLEQIPRKNFPFHWAATQNNLGNTLLVLGEREADSTKLAEAVTAFENALKEWTRDKVPLDWALAQNNLGNALCALGELEADSVKLAEAVTAFANALLERTQDKVPLDWAMTQNNLGNALRALGEREADGVKLAEAVTAYEKALKERTQDKVPLDWAMTQNNLGNALMALGEREADSAKLDKAVTAYENALKERTRDKVPLDWAGTQNNLANLFCAFFDLEADPAHLDRAEEHIDAALDVFRAAGADRYVRVAESIKSDIQARRLAL